MTTATLPFPQPLAEKYRPLSIAEFVGLDKPKKILSKFAANPYPSAWLFVGPSGLGKTSMAFAVAEEIGAEIQHIPSKNCDLQTIEEVCRRCHYVPMQPRKFWAVIVDECDHVTEGAQLALLSKLDATAFPPNTVFFFTANWSDAESHTIALEPRFLSRCRVLEFSKHGIAPGAANLLREIFQKEAPGMPEPNYARIVKESNNNVRDALMNLELAILAA
jgi:replication-associated recombination protein RarA